MNQRLCILDTDTASHLQHGRQRIARRAADPPEQPCITVITQIEMREGRYHGLRTAANKEQLLRAWQLLQDTEAFLLFYAIRNTQHVFSKCKPFSETCSLKHVFADNPPLVD